MSSAKSKFLTAACLSFGMVVMFAGTSHAQPRAHDREVQASGGIFHAQGSDSGTISADLSIGKYLDDPAWQVGFRQGLNYSFIDNGTDVWTATTVPYFQYHFRDFTPDNRTLPFIGGFAGAIWNDRDITGTLGPEIGVKFFMTKQTFASVRYRYEWFFSDLSLGGVTNNRSDGNHVGTFGIGYLWGDDGER